MQRVLFFLAFSTMCGELLAAPSLTLSSPTNLATVVVGQSFTVNVTLSGLPSGDALELLGATVKFESPLLGAPTSVTGGAILPNPLDNPSDFLTSSGLGFGDATFQTFGTTASDFITTNGTFFSFNVIAQAAGNGQLFFDFSDALQHNNSDPESPIDPGLASGPSLPFTVAVPEPAGLICIGTGLLPLIRRRNCKR